MRPRQRLGWFLRQMYPGVGAPKRLARDLEISEKAARRLFADHWPADDTFAAILRRFGNEAWAALAAPEIGPVLAELTEKEARLERELQGLRARQREVAGLVEGRTYRVASAAEEAAGPVNLDLFEGSAQ